MRSLTRVALAAALLLVAAAGETGVLDDEGIVRRYEVQGLAGEAIRLPCEVDEENCGGFHNIKWYKGTDRVYVFSERDNFRRAEGPLTGRTDFNFSTNRLENWLEIVPLDTTDEGTYRCEITYMVVREVCSIVQFTNLTTFARPTYHHMTFKDGSPIDNDTTIGPFDEGTQLELICESGGGKPVPRITWWNDTTQLAGNYNSVVNDNGTGTGTSILRLVASRGDLASRGLFCIVENEAMNEPARLRLKLNVNVAPQLVDVLELHDYPVTEGSNVVLKCDVRGARPAASIAWFNGSVPIEQADTLDNIREDTGRIEDPDGTFSTWSRLQFKGTRFENQRTFTCQAHNSVLKHRGLPPMTHSIDLDVQFAPSVRVTPENITVNETMDILIHCDYQANPHELKYVLWYQDTEQLNLAGLHDKYGNGNVDHPSLLIKNVTARDSGVYTCRLANEIGPSTVVNYATVDVQFPPELQVVMEPSEPVSEEDHMNVTLICDILQANPDGLERARWFLDGKLLKELPECDGNETLYLENSELCGIDPSRLVLENVNREFHGNYSCEGMNSAGWGARSPTKELVVQYAPSQAYITYQPPNVIKGKTLTLSCNLDDPGRPEATSVRWYRGRRLIPDVTSLSWQIDPVSLETESNFTCVPYNSEGESVPGDVDIDVMARPFFITRLPPYQGFLMNSKKVSLSCRVECSPLCSITWRKNGLPLQNSTHYKVISSVKNPDPSSGDLESVMSVLEWRMDKWPNRELDREKDNSNYTCVSSSNSAGTGVSSNAYFRVEYPPERIKVTHTEIKVIENETPPRVSCQAFSYPEPTYTWQLGDDIKSKGSVFNLGLPITREQSGLYECIADNRHGTLTAQTFFDVMYKPECAIDRQDEGNGDNAKIILYCRAAANPDDVDFRWRFGNESLIEDVRNKGMESRLTLPASASSLGTYYCYVNNTIGESIPCEIDVTGIMEVPKDNIIVISAIIAAAVLLLLIICVIIILLCRRQRQAGKYPDRGAADDGKKKVLDMKNGGPGTEDEPRQFYENLPFHGMAAAPNKPLLNLAGDMDYADVDSQTYAYGPIQYKAASITAANEKKAEREAEVLGVPVRPPRK
uniref:Neural cell adhesion molecule 1-like n=1 Tax=Hirondellea gigas TaxID=1518452 RepID=A0A2P2I4X8_9CRUS